MDRKEQARLALESLNKCTNVDQYSYWAECHSQIIRELLEEASASDPKLPYDVQIGSTIFRQGVALRLVVDKAKRDNAALMAMHDKYEPLPKMDIEAMITASKATAEEGE